MSEPPREPYRKEPDLSTVIPPDRRQRERLLLAITSATIGAAVASIITLVGVRLSQSPAPPPIVMAAAPVTIPPTVVETATPAATCVIAPGMDPTRSPPVLPMVPRYPGGVMRSSFNVGAGSASVALETCDSVDDVVAFYRTTKGLDSDGEREALHGRDLFFSRPTDTTIEVFKVGISSERGITKIVIGEGTPRRRAPAPERTARKPGASLPGISDRF
jgi:hypothetical protein